MTVGRLRIPGVAEPAIDAAVDAALRQAFTVVDETCAHFADAVLANGVFVGEEAHRQNGHLLDDASRLSERMYRRLPFAGRTGLPADSPAAGCPGRGPAGPRTRWSRGDRALD
jgi:hypothetical protein